MTRQEVLDQFKEILCYTVKDPQHILPRIVEEADLYTDLGLTSVGLLYSVIAIEERFGVHFEEVDRFHTVKDVVDFILEQRAS